MTYLLSSVLSSRGLVLAHPLLFVSFDSLSAELFAQRYWRGVVSTEVLARSCLHRGTGERLFPQRYWRGVVSTEVL